MNGAGREKDKNGGGLHRFLLGPSEELCLVDGSEIAHIGSSEAVLHKKKEAKMA